jgi:hypothetical protein
MSDRISVLEQLRAKGVLRNIGKPTPVNNSPPFDLDAWIAQAVIEVNQPDDAPSIPVSAPLPVSSLSPRHQKKIGLPVTKAPKSILPASSPQKSTLLDRVRACRMKSKLRDKKFGEGQN